MKLSTLLKLALVGLMLAPVGMDAAPAKRSKARTTQTTKKRTTKKKSSSSKTSSSKTTAAKNTKDYPLFDSVEAKRLWRLTRDSQEFSQDDYTSAITLCQVAYDYLIADMQEILEKYNTFTSRTNAFNNLDSGKGCELFAFVGRLSNPMQQCGYDGKLSTDNVRILNEMVRTKKRFLNVKKELFQD